MKRVLLVALLATLTTGCSATWRVSGRAESPAERTTSRSREVGERYSRLHIPPGHLPKPGECRIWHPGTPPGHQPPAGDCAELASQVPPGSWLISRASKKSKHFEVAVYDEVLVGSVLEILLYSTKDGSYIGRRAVTPQLASSGRR